MMKRRPDGTARSFWSTWGAAPLMLTPNRTASLKSARWCVLTSDRRSFFSRPSTCSHVATLKRPAPLSCLNASPEKGGDINTRYLRSSMPHCTQNCETSLKRSWINRSRRQHPPPGPTLQIDAPQADFPIIEPLAAESHPGGLADPAHAPRRPHPRL
jgi:hypothetical protein